MSHSVGVVDPLLPGRIYLFCRPETFSQMMRRTPSPTGAAGRQRSRQRPTRSDTNKMLPQCRNLLYFLPLAALKSVWKLALPILKEEAKKQNIQAYLRG